jgi:hypothetical protein
MRISRKMSATKNEFFAQQRVERNAAKVATRARKAFILAQMEGQTTINESPVGDVFSSIMCSLSELKWID